MRPPVGKMSINAMARKIDVDNRIPLRNYYRHADYLLKQALIYREEKNTIYLYVMLLRYSSLVLDTINLHRDYLVLCSEERAYSKKQLSVVIDELESLQPEVHRQVDALNKHHIRSEEYQPNDHGGTLHRSGDSSFKLPAVNNTLSFGPDDKQLHQRESALSLNQNLGNTPNKQSGSVNMQFQKLSPLPTPGQETLSSHSLLGLNGLRDQLSNPSAQIKVQHPSYSDFNSSDNLSLIQSVQSDITGVKDGDSGVDISTTESVLSMDDEQSDEDYFFSGNIRQPSPPPVLARLQPEHSHISPSRVADPRPGPANSFQDDSPTSNTYQHLHIPVKMMQDFMRFAQQNTERNLETCGVLAASLKNWTFQITTLIIPKQKSTSYSCQSLSEEDIFEIQDKRSLFIVGWIHTHPSQTCFMSSVDLHTHYSYQCLLPEAIAVVMAPTDESSPHGIFHLSDPVGMKLIRNCDERGFHPHEKPDDGSPIYERCSHVYMNEIMDFDVVDLR